MYLLVVTDTCPWERYGSFCFKEIALIRVQLEGEMIISGTRIAIPELSTHRERKWRQHKILLKQVLFFLNVHQFSKNYKNIKDCNRIALEKKAVVYKNKHAFVLGLKWVFVFIWVLFFLQDSVKEEESTGLFNRVAQKKRRTCFPHYKTLAEDACLRSEIQTDWHIL